MFSLFVLSAISYKPICSCLRSCYKLLAICYTLFSYNVCASTDNTAGKSRTIGSQLSPPSADP